MSLGATFEAVSIISDTRRRLVLALWFPQAFHGALGYLRYDEAADRKVFSPLRRDTLSAKW
jgi:hypothetical protein